MSLLSSGPRCILARASAGDVVGPGRLTGWASRDANCGIFAACTAVGGTRFCAQAGTIATAINSVATTARDTVRNRELRDRAWLCIGLSSLPSSRIEMEFRTGALGRLGEGGSEVLFLAAWA